MSWLIFVLPRRDLSPSKLEVDINKLSSTWEKSNLYNSDERKHVVQNEQSNSSYKDEKWIMKQTPIANNQTRQFPNQSVQLEGKPIKKSFSALLIINKRFINKPTTSAFVVWFMVFSTTFNNISAISWRSVLLLEDTGVPREYHRPVASHRKT